MDYASVNSITIHASMMMYGDVILDIEQNDHILLIRRYAIADGGILLVQEEQSFTDYSN